MFSHSVYVGPQEYRRLTAIGHDLNDVNPYGVVGFSGDHSAGVGADHEILLWMHQHLHLAYGWVIVLFGIAVRLALWLSIRRRMRSGMAMQPFNRK